MYYDDFAVGRSFTSGGRTITESDLVKFSEISGVFSPLHLDEEYCRNTVFKKRIAHGPLVLSISNGLVAALNLYEESLIALLSLEWKFLEPVFLGDTVRAVETVESMRVSKDPSKGVVTFVRVVRNQDDHDVQKGTLVVLLKKKPVGTNVACDMGVRAEKS